MWQLLPSLQSLGEKRQALYLDLESERDRAKLAEPELYLADDVGHPVILVAQMEAHGFRLAKEHTFLPYQYFLVFEVK